MARLLAVLLPLLVVALGLVGIRAVGSTATDPVVARAVADLARAPADLVVLGNSVALQAVDADLLSRERRTVLAAVPGGQPAHWIAMARHRVFGAGHHPRVVLLYAPLHVATRVRLPDDVDRAMLLDLLTKPDHALVQAALGRGDTAWDALARDRRRAREALLRVVGTGPLALWYDRGRPTSVVEPALDRLFRDQVHNGGPAPAAVPGQAGPVAAPRAPSPGAPAGQAALLDDPIPAVTPSDLDVSLLPALVDTVRGAGARLVYALPAARAGGDLPCDDPDHAAAIRWLTTRNVDVIDLTWAPVPPAHFSTNHHVDPAGRALVTAELVRGLHALGDRAPDAPGGAWGDCRDR